MRVTIGASPRAAVVALAALCACNRSSEGVPDANADPASTVAVEPVRSPDVAGTAGGRGHAKEGPFPSSAPVSPPLVHPAPSARPAPSASAAVLVHPLADWMRGPATRAFLSGDLDSIAASFDEMASWAPAEYPNWASIAKDGADAARAGSLEGAKAACRGCHQQYLAQYKAAFANRPLP